MNNASAKEAGNESSASPEGLRSQHTETERVILRRRSVRNYRKEQVPAWMVKRVLEAGRFAPTQGNAQSWKLVVLRDPKMIDEMTTDVLADAKKFYERFDYLRKGQGWRRFITKFLMRRYPSQMHPIPFAVLSMIGHGLMGLFHGAPTVILLFKDVRGILSPELDCGILGQNMVLAAHSLGLGTCWVSFAKVAFGPKSKWNERLGIEYPYEIATSIVLGFPLGDPDGMVPRPLHPIDWYEDGKRQTLWEQDAVRRLPPGERGIVPDFRTFKGFESGLVKVDEEKCTGCGLCAKACMARRMQVVDKKARVMLEAGCSACSACMAICPTHAITTVKDMRITSSLFTFTERGELSPPRLFEDE